MVDRTSLISDFERADFDHVEWINTALAAERCARPSGDPLLASSRPPVTPPVPRRADDDSLDVHVADMLMQLQVRTPGPESERPAAAHLRRRCRHAAVALPRRAVLAARRNRRCIRQSAKCARPANRPSRHTTPHTERALFCSASTRHGFRRSKLGLHNRWRCGPSENLREIEVVRKEAAVLQGQTDVLRQQLQARVESITAPQLAVLTELDAIKEKASECVEKLQKAEGLDKLRLQVDQAFRTGSAHKVGGALAALRTALEVVGDRPEAIVYTSKLPEWTQQLEAMVVPAMRKAIDTADVEQAAMFRDVLGGIGQADTVVDVYKESSQARIMLSWMSFGGTGFDPSAETDKVPPVRDFVEWHAVFCDQVVALCKHELGWNHELLPEPQLVLKTLIAEAVGALQPPLHTRAIRWLEQDVTAPAKAAEALCRLHETASAFAANLAAVLANPDTGAAPDAAATALLVGEAEKKVRASIFSPFVSLQQSYLSCETKQLQQCSNNSKPNLGPPLEAAAGLSNVAATVDAVTTKLEHMLVRVPSGFAELVAAALDSIGRAERFCGGMGLVGLVDRAVATTLQQHFSSLDQTVRSLTAQFYQPPPAKTPPRKAPPGCAESTEAGPRGSTAAGLVGSTTAALQEASFTLLRQLLDGRATVLVEIDRAVQAAASRSVDRVVQAAGGSQHGAGSQHGYLSAAAAMDGGASGADRAQTSPALQAYAEHGSEGSAAEAERAGSVAALRRLSRDRQAAPAGWLGGPTGTWSSCVLTSQVLVFRAIFHPIRHVLLSLPANPHWSAGPATAVAAGAAVPVFSVGPLEYVHGIAEQLLNVPTVVPTDDGSEGQTLDAGQAEAVWKEVVGGSRGSGPVLFDCGAAVPPHRAGRLVEVADDEDEDEEEGDGGGGGGSDAAYLWLGLLAKSTAALFINQITAITSIRWGGGIGHTRHNCFLLPSRAAWL